VSKIPHHNITEKKAHSQCIYCGRKISDERWASQHMYKIHYKTITCACGKETRKPVVFHGSGHDNWDKKGWISILDFEKMLLDIAKKNERIEEKIRKTIIA
jgi:NAD-dependent SIR2 family protein deacetylase